LARKGKKQVLLTDEEEGEEVQAKLPAIQLPVLKKACTTAGTEVKLPDPDLPLMEKAAYFVSLLFDEIGTLSLNFPIINVHNGDLT
jgi:hypothetical protein